MSFPILGTPKPQFFDSSGNPLSGGLLSVYEPADDTEKNSYPTADDADAATNANTNPIILNSRGEPTTGFFGVDGEDYKLILQDSLGSTIWTSDDVNVPWLSPEEATYTPAGTGAVDRTIQSKLDDVLSIKDFGAVGDGVTNDTGAVHAWLAHAVSTGETVYAPEGTYLMDSYSVTSLSNDVHVECHRNAIFKYRTAESTPLLSFEHTTAGVYGLTWRGGVLDNTGGAYVSDTQSNTCLELVRLWRSDISEVYFKGEATHAAAIITTTGTDSGITTVDCSRTKIHGNWFQGQGDGGIYLSGGSLTAASDDGGETIITGNWFWENHQAVVMKRDVDVGQIYGNQFYRNRTGILAVEADSVDPAQVCQIFDNFFRQTETRCIEVSTNDYYSIHNNVCEDWGFLLSEGDSPTTLSGEPYAYIINGSDNTDFHGNSCYQKNWTDTIVGLRGLFINAVTVNSVLYTPNNNWVHHNFFHDCQYAVAEGTSGSNTYESNKFENVTTPYFSLDATSIIVATPTSEIVTATNVITPDETGKTFYLNSAGGFASTLPVPHLGLKYTFIVKTAPTTAYTVGSDNGDNEMTVKILDVVGELTHATARDVVTFVANTSVIGDRLEVECDGTNWNCVAFSGADGGITTGSS